MFGVMKAHTCAQPAAQQQHRRLHYSGTCKTLGSLYGQKSRLMLNYDAVFLGEVLSAISGADLARAQWHRAYQSYNCLALPASADAMPLALQFAATAAVLMTEFKVADQIADSHRSRWKIAQRWFAKSFRVAAAQLRA